MPDKPDAEPTLTEPPIKIETCAHGGTSMSVSLVIDNRHVDLSTFAYKHMVGNRIRVTLYDMQRETVLELVKSLLDVVSTWDARSAATYQG